MTVLATLTTLHREAAYTATLAATLFMLASGAAWVMSRNQSRETQRFWRLTFRHLAALGFMLGLAVIWKAELQSVLVALGAATAGFLVAFRENWLSLLGFWMRFVRRQYDLHDFIEVDGVRGKVIDITWLYTVVAESVPGKTGTLYSGKVVHIPNNRMLLAPLTVDNLTDEYTLHIITLPLPKGAKPLAAEKVLLAAANQHCAPYFTEARKHMKLLEQEKALEISSVEPKSFLSVGDDSIVTIRVRIIVPEEARSRLTQAILHQFFEQVDEAGWPSAPLK
jgi:small-conductance mechanosensitive channel